MFNWNYLETFVILSEKLSFSETAKILNTAQPVISRQIRLLEENLGYALFIRTKKSVSLTSEGQDLKRKLGPLVEEVKRVMTADQSKLTPVLKMNIRIGSMHEAGEILLMPRVSKFLDLHPETTLHVTLQGVVQTNELIAKGLLDFGFVYQASDHKSVKSFPFAQDTPVMIASKKLSGHWRKNETYHFVNYRENDLYTKKFLERNLTKSERAKVRTMYSINSHRAILELVQKHNCLAVVPQSSVQKALDRGIVEIVVQDKKPQTLLLVCHEQTLIDKRKKLFLDFLLRSSS